MNPHPLIEPADFELFDVLADAAFPTRLVVAGLAEAAGHRVKRTGVERRLRQLEVRGVLSSVKAVGATSRGQDFVDSWWWITETGWIAFAAASAADEWRAPTPELRGLRAAVAGALLEGARTTEDLAEIVGRRPMLEEIFDRDPIVRSLGLLALDGLVAGEVRAGSAPVWRLTELGRTMLSSLST